ncbi:NAD(P)H-hydrate dehydratase [Candidatus Micrarchaeota archaeon]|nr:NAD(P)H-hydrate dehydratase [Candidatus Micrarchaeota archaeon]
MQKHIKRIKKPKCNSRKGQNGRLLVIAGGKKYHGSLWFAVETASHFCDLVYVYSPFNKCVLESLKKKTPAFISISKKDYAKTIEEVDVFLVGPGIDLNIISKKLIKKLLETKKKCVLDAGALRLIKPEQLHKNCLITPHNNEFKNLFGCDATKQNIKNMAKKYGCVILSKSQVDNIASSTQKIEIKGGNEGLTKGGTGDVLAALCASFSCRNNLFDSAVSASYLNKQAGERLYKKFGPYYSVEQLINQIILTLRSIKK